MAAYTSARYFDVYSDPGHGWIKVPNLLLHQLGIAHKITPYSYMRGNYAYLEEDADAATFFEAMDRARCAVIQREHNSSGYSRIRNYQRYIAPAPRIGSEG